MLRLQQAEVLRLALEHNYVATAEQKKHHVATAAPCFAGLCLQLYRPQKV